MIDYEVGQIPSFPLGITVKDEDDNPLNLIGYPDVRVELLGSDNEIVDTSDVDVEASDMLLGSYIITWPKNRSLFTKQGIYKIRLVLSKEDGSIDYTRPREIRVRRFGRLND